MATTLFHADFDCGGGPQLDALSVESQFFEVPGPELGRTSYDP